MTTTGHEMDSLNRSERFEVRWRPFELEAVKRVAAAERMRTSEFVRAVVMDSVRRRLARDERHGR